MKVGDVYVSKSVPGTVECVQVDSAQGRAQLLCKGVSGIPDGHLVWDRIDYVEHYWMLVPPALSAQSTGGTWEVGAYVERGWRDGPVDFGTTQAVDAIPPGTTGKILEHSPQWTKVGWASGETLRYLRPHEYMKLIPTPPGVARPNGCACSRCAKPFPYEPPPSGKCAECRIVESML